MYRAAALLLSLLTFGVYIRKYKAYNDWYRDEVLRHALDIIEKYIVITVNDSLKSNKINFKKEEF